MRSPFRRPAVIAVGLLLGLFVVANAGEMRTWTSKNGKAKIQAKLLSADKDKLTLEREDGKKIVVPLKDLSAADQKYVADNNDTDNPFNTPAEEGGAAGEPAVKEVDRSQERQVSLVPVKDKWAFTAPEKPAGAKAARGSGLPPIKDWEGIKWLAINGTGKTAAVGYLLAGGRFGSKEKGTTRLVLTDIETGKQKAAVAAEAQMVPLAVDDAGKRVVMCREVFGEGNRERLEIWEAEGASLKRAAAWLP